MMICEGCSHAMKILNDECKEEPACELRDNMDLYIQGIETCAFREGEEH